MSRNRAQGRTVHTLPVVSNDGTFYTNLTDGNPETFSQWRSWAKSALFVVDLGGVDAIDEVRVVCSNVQDYFAGWHNLKPPLALYVGDTLEALRHVADRNPSANYEHVSEDERQVLVVPGFAKNCCAENCAAPYKLPAEGDERQHNRVPDTVGYTVNY